MGSDRLGGRILETNGAVSVRRQLFLRSILDRLEHRTELVATLVQMRQALIYENL